MRRLWRPPPGDVPLARGSTTSPRAGWTSCRRDCERHGRPYERRLLDEALDALRTLGPTQEDVVLCHQDLHGGNILRAEREPWLAIDSKPIVAERAYDIVPPFAIDADGRISAAELRRRLDLLSELLGLDRERDAPLGDREASRVATGGQYFERGRGGAAGGRGRLSDDDGDRREERSARRSASRPTSSSRSSPTA